MVGTAVSAADRHHVRIPRHRWRRLVRDLAARGQGRRESGAFLLARQPDARRVSDWIPFDELDPDALNGAISIRGEAFTRLWKLCAQREMRVIADVHTHPGSGVAQSPVDSANPMVARQGHVAIILPRFAAGRPRPGETGVHVYRGDRTWESHFERDATHLLRLTWW
jgi:proteasome lid subunit RPN8/RPN11